MCTSEEQVVKTLRMQTVGRRVVGEMVRVGEEENNGMICRIPLHILGGVLGGSQNGLGKSSKALPVEGFFGFMRYRV